MGCIWEGDVNESLPGGPAHQATYVRLSTIGLIYIRNIHPACWLPTLHMDSGKDLVWSVKETLDSSLWQMQQPYCLYPHFKAFTAVDTSAKANLCENM